MTRFASPADHGEARDERDERHEASQDPREESVAQRADRNISELVQELRVVGLGVQVLFGFLLSLPFTMRFTKLDGAQRDLYESLRMAGHAEVRRVIASKGLGGSTITILDALMKLRQVCCDPRLVRAEAAASVRQSAKYDVLI